MSFYAPTLICLIKFDSVQDVPAICMIEDLMNHIYLCLLFSILECCVRIYVSVFPCCVQCLFRCFVIVSFSALIRLCMLYAYYS